MIPLFLRKYAVLIAGYVAAGIFCALWLGARDNLAAEVEACNTRAEKAAREAIEATKEAQISAYERQIRQIELLAQNEREARILAEKAAQEAQSRPERVRTVVREVASENVCIDTVVPDAVLDSLCTGTSGLEAGGCGSGTGRAAWDSFGFDPARRLTDDP